MTILATAPAAGFRLLAAAASMATIAACSGGGGGGGGGGSPFPTPTPIVTSSPSPPPGPNPIKHVVIIMQENRSFNNLFMGYPRAKTASSGKISSGQTIALAPVPLAIPWDLEHAADGYIKSCNGTGSIPGTNCRMNGFDREIKGCGGSGQPPCPVQYPEYSYVPRSQVTPYWTMASRYVLADEMYASNFDASSFVSHQYIIAGQSQSAVDYPTGAWGCPGGPSDTVGLVTQQRQYPVGKEVVCWDPTTLGDELDKAGLSWSFFAPAVNSGDGIWSSYQAIKHIYNGPDWKNNVFAPSTQFFTNLQNGDFRTVTWIMPTYTNSDHPGSNSGTGPSWVASLVNAIGKSPYWNTTAIFILWDDYGGFYDSEAPAYVDYDGLGIRVPMLIVSPYSDTGKVSHVHYEHGSILRFIEDTFRLPQMAASDKRASSPAQDAFNFKQKPRPFVPIPSQFDRRYFMLQPLDLRPPDDN